MKLNLGSGFMGADSPWSGDDWLNVDVHAFEKENDWTKAKYVNFDMKNILWPIESNSADCIWASHIMEHFNYLEVQAVIKECYRVMKFGSPMRIVCPDPRKFIINWQIKNKQFILDCMSQDYWDRWNYEKHLNIGFTDMFFPEHLDHSLCPSIDYIMICLIRVGFSKVWEASYGITEFHQFFGGHEVGETMDNRPHLSWYLEAVK